ncbi:MAG: tRNA pseudouridine(54/55) synthase Pus10 [Promethearchaeota archaeon]
MNRLKGGNSVNILGIVKKILLEYELCDHCLGRQFAMLGSGISNEKRGEVLRMASILESHANLKEFNEDDDKNFNLKEDKAFLKAEAREGNAIAIKVTSEENIFVTQEPAREEGVNEVFRASKDKGKARCELCGNVFSKEFHDKIISIALEEISGLEFLTFLVGSKFPAEMMEKEDEFRVKYHLKWGESLKGHFNRFIGKALSKKLDKMVDFKSPDIVVLFSINPEQESMVDIQVNPYFIFGRYRKLKRGIPQTHWPHKECRGKGCEGCNFTGKQYMESVEELISPAILDYTKGESTKFHGAGREDIDALMLGNGRPFVVEILKGKIRELDYKSLEKEINDRCDGKVQVTGLRPSSKSEMQKIKSSASTTKKYYRALCQLEKPIDEETLQKIKNSLLATPIKQRTPARVLHRRANKTRIKKVFDFSWEYVNDDRSLLQVYLFFETEGGTYVKELISSDDGRTVPSVSGIAGQQVTCIELDVLRVDLEGLEEKQE